jgi:hypothetical protein
MAQSLGRIAGVSAKTAIKTTFVTMIAGLLLAAASWHLMREHGSWAWAAAALAAIEAIIVGIAFGLQRGMARGLEHAFESLKVGETITRMIFDRLLTTLTVGGVDQAARRLPLAQAEQALAQVVHGALGTGDTDGRFRGWLRRWLRNKLLSHVELVTLARFRTAGSNEGGIDLSRLQEELQAHIDEQLAASARHAERIWMIAVVAGLPAVVFTQTWLIGTLLSAT